MIKKKVIALGISMVMATTVLSGCGLKSDTPVVGDLFGLKSDEVFVVDKLICSVSEAKLIILNSANKYKNDFGGIVDWSQKLEKTTLGDFVKDEVKNDISITYTMAALADKNNVTIDDAEKTSIAAAAKEYYNSLTDEEKDYTTATEETVETLFTNYYKAKKAYNTLTANVGEEISDEEARVIKVQYIHIDTTKTKTNKATKQLEEVISLVNGGYQTFAKEAKQYSDDELVTKTIKKNEATQDYEIAAFDLANEEMSSIITQDDGLYLVYCENSYLKDETAQNKSAIIESTKNSAFSKVYDNYISDVKSDFNTSAWDDIALPDGENMVSTNIMDVFDTIAAE